MNKLKRFFDAWSSFFVMIIISDPSLRVASSAIIQTDKKVDAIAVKSLLPDITYVLNFWNEIYANLFVR